MERLGFVWLGELMENELDLSADLGFAVTLVPAEAVRPASVALRGALERTGGMCACGAVGEPADRGCVVRWARRVQQRHDRVGESERGAAGKCTLACT